MLVKVKLVRLTEKRLATVVLQILACIRLEAQMPSHHQNQQPLTKSHRSERTSYC